MAGWKNGRFPLPLCAAVCILVAWPVSATAQSPAPRIRVGAGVSADLLVGDASDFLDGGLGRFLMADFPLGARGLWQLRLDGSWTSLEDDDDELTGALAQNDVVTLVAGPQLSLQLGRFRPFAAALAGFTAVVWQTEHEGVGGSNDDSGSESGFAFGAHAGLALTLAEGDNPVGIQAEGRILQAGEYDFARAPFPGNPPAPVGLIRHDMAALSLRIAFTLGF